MCWKCGAKKEVTRPKIIKTMIVKRPFMSDTGVRFEETLEKTILGGTDACLVCAKKAEIEYQQKILGEKYG